MKIIKLFGLCALLLIAAFFANFFGFVSLPWLDINQVPTYSEDARRTNDAVQNVFK